MIYNIDMVEDIIRAELNIYAITRLTSAQILTAINDAQLQVATRSLCIEKEALISTISGRNTIKSQGIRTNYIELITTDSMVVFTNDDVVFTDDDVEWNTIAAAADIKIGLQCILPTNIGSAPTIRSTEPQYYFNWNDYLIIEPTPDDNYVLKLYYSDYPALLTSTSDVLEVPEEFQQCVIDFALHLISIKLQRWTSVGLYYNKYVTSLQVARAIYVKKYPDYKSSREIPKSIKPMGE